MSCRYPRSVRLKRRPLIRSLFGRSSPGLCRISAGPLTLAARLVNVAQLPKGVRVQVGVATGRDLRGVHRTRRRRQLTQAFREGPLQALCAEADRLPADQGIALMVLDGRTGRRLRGLPLQSELGSAVPELVRRLFKNVPTGTIANQTR